MRKLLYHLVAIAIVFAPLCLAGCGDGGNQVVQETEEYSFDKMEEMAAKETEEAEKNPD